MADIYYHDKLKKWAKDILLKRGFAETEIFEEYQIKSNSGKYFIDVVGISVNKKVAIECGLTELDKIDCLKSVFDDVIVLPYTYFPKVISEAEQKIKKYNDVKTMLTDFGCKYMLLSAKIELVLKKLKTTKKISDSEYDEIDYTLFHETNQKNYEQIKKRMDSIIENIEYDKRVIPYQNWVYRD